MMIRLFQVNAGVYLELNRDVPPTALVRDICSAVESVSGEDARNQVLLTAEGEQMDSNRVIGSYPTGTDSKPIFLFFKTYLTSAGPPSAPSHVKPSSGLQRQLELLHLKPSPAMFQHQTALAKLLGEYASSLKSASVQIACEYGLQIAGWEAVLKNCGNIVRMYQKHHQLFCRTLEAFQASKQHYLNLLNKFPEQVELLQDLPLPPGHTAHSLYEWISTHDEKNSLEDLSTECEKALEQVESKPIHAAITTSEKILAGADLSLSQTQPFHQHHSHLKELASTASQLAGIQNSLSENVQSTSQRALRSGDAGTIADLVISHHSSLQLMSQQNTQLEGIVREMEATKDKLQGQLHSALCSVTDLQMRLAESNGHLMLLYEHVKLAQKRFDVLEQVSSTPDVLAQVVAEVEQRRAFRDTLHQKAAALSSALSRAREEERGRRRSFLASYGQHFVTTLFPELQTKTPELTVQLSGASPSDSADLSKIKRLLPSVSGCATFPTSVAFLTSTSEITQTSHCVDVATQSSNMYMDAGTQTDSTTHLDAGTQTDSTTHLDAGTQTDSTTHLDAGTQTDGTHLDAGTQTDGTTHLDAGTQTNSSTHLDAGTQTDSECLEEMRELCVRVRELEGQLEVERGESARREKLLATESEQRLQEMKRLEALCQQHSIEMTILRQEIDQHQSQLSKAKQQYEVELSGLEQCSQEQAKEMERCRVHHQQAQEMLGCLKGQLELAEGRVHSLEEEREGLREQLELAEGRVHSLEEERASALEGVECERKKVEEMEHQLQQERDSHLKLCMELEREVKELRRAVVGVELPAAPQDSQKPQASGAMVCPVDRITISNLQVGDVALFMTDGHGNYLALSVDGKTYYLNHSCVSSFSQYLSSKAQHLNLKRKLLLGRITERTFVEVRKEGNRLHVPVGSRLYKVNAEEAVTM